MELVGLLVFMCVLRICNIRDWKSLPVPTTRFALVQPHRARHPAATRHCETTVERMSGGFDELRITPLAT
jgi:hypothetical protein